MKIKTDIEIVTGLLGSGKTHFINTLLENTMVAKEKVLVIQYESGEQKINPFIHKKGKIIIKEQDTSDKLTSEYIKQMIDFYNPHRIIIEHNGMRLLGETLSIFDDSPVVYYMADASTFDMFFINMKELIEPYVYHSNLIILNNCNLIDKSKVKSLKKQIEALNLNAFIIAIGSMNELSSELQRADVLDNSILKNIRIAIRNVKLSNFIRRR